MSQPTADWSHYLSEKMAALAKNPADFSAQNGVQTLLAQMLRRVVELEARVARLEQGKAP